MPPVSAQPVASTNSGSVLPPDNSIGFIRLLLAAAVIYSHAHLLGGFSPEWLIRFSGGTVIAGHAAVQIFFVISGILIAESCRRQRSLRLYLWHRFLRLAPALWGCLVITAFILTPLCWFTSKASSVSPGALWSDAADYVAKNLILPRRQISIQGFPAGVPWPGDWNGSLWTLFYEGACYLMVAGLGLLGLVGRWRRIGAVLLLSFVGLFTVVEATGSSRWPAFAVLFNTPGKQLTVLFLAGAAWSAFPAWANAISRRTWTGGAAAALLLIAWRTELNPVFAPWILPPLVIWLGAHLPWRNLERRVGGDYSYGLYVYGYPIQQVLSHFRVQEWGFLPYLGMSLLVTSLFAITSWHLLEKRALSLKSRGLGAPKMWVRPRPAPVTLPCPPL